MRWARKALWLLPRMQWRHTFSEIADGEFIPRIVRQILKSDIWYALSYHKMHDDEALEHHRPCRISESVLKGTKDFCDAMISAMSGYEDVFDVLRLWLGELSDSPPLAPDNKKSQRSLELRSLENLTFIFVAPFTDFSNEFAIETAPVAR